MIESVKAFCPRCEKLYRIQSESIKEAEPRFECADCKSIFCFKWPQPPGTEFVATYISEKPLAEAPLESKPESKIEKKPTLVSAGGAGFKSSFKTGNAAGSIPPELEKAWQGVKDQYQDHLVHDAFIQLCMRRGALAVASQNYRQMLGANPADSIAQSMQNRIVDMATTTFLSKPMGRTAGKSKGYGVLTVFAVIGVLCMILGFFYTPLRSLIALGASLMVFGSILRTIRKSI